MGGGTGMRWQGWHWCLPTQAIERIGRVGHPQILLDWRREMRGGPRPQTEPQRLARSYQKSRCKQWSNEMARNRNRESLTCIVVVVLLIALVASRTQVCLAQGEKSRDLNRSFLHEPGSPLKAIQTGGFAVVLRNVGKKEILNWGEVCLARSGNGYKILKMFTLDVESPLKPGYAEGDSRSMDASPIVICRSRGGILAISQVQFGDGSSWKSRWLKATLPKVPSVQK